MDQRNADNRIIPYKKKKPLNIWILGLCALVFIYLVVNFFMYTFNGQIAISEVTEGVTTGRFDSQYTALVLREESVVNAADSGYVNYFAGEGSRIDKGEAMYMLDKNGDFSSMIEDLSQEEAVLDTADIDKLNDSYYDFNTAFDDQAYYETYNFKYRIESQILDAINSNALGGIAANIDTSKDYTIVNSDYAGIMVHSYDGFEGFSEENIESRMFKRTNYSRKVIKTNEYVNKDTPVCKIITDDSWKLIFQISNNKEYTNLSNVDIKILKDNIETSGSFTTFTKAGNTYGIISLNKYMIRYISDRYLQISITDDTKEGLKIPKSAVFDHQFYIIPADYLVQGGDSNNYGFNLQTTVDGKSTNKFVKPSMDFSSDEYIFVDVDTGVIKEGDILIKNDSADTYKIGKKENRSCAYVIESGYAKLKTIDIIGENGSSYIISKSNGDGINIYDQVVRNYQSVNEGQEVN